MKILYLTCLPFIVLAWFTAIAPAYPVHPRSSSSPLIRDGLDQGVTPLVLRDEPGIEVVAREPNASHNVQQIIRKAKHIIKSPYHAIMDHIKPQHVSFDPNRMVADRLHVPTGDIVTHPNHHHSGPGHTPHPLPTPRPRPMGPRPMIKKKFP